MNIVDTAGQEEYENLRNKYVSDGDAFIIVYSVTDKSTFDEVEKFLEKIFKGKASKVGQDPKTIIAFTPILLIGNKIDLEGRREVTSEDAQTLCKKYGLALLETSAKKRLNVEETFGEICEQVLSKTTGNEKVEQLLGKNGKLKNEKKKCNIQ